MITVARVRSFTTRSLLGGTALVPQRLLRLAAGLILFGVSVALMIRARLGLGPWDVFHQGLAAHTGLPFGSVVIAVSAIVLLLWIPLRQRPGLGTIANAITIGLIVEATLAILPSPSPLILRVTYLLAGIFVTGVATGLYIGAGMGPGSRDGLMTGLGQRGYSIRVVRTAIELSVLAIGWALGGTVGVGTVLYACGIGPLVHIFLPLLTVSIAPTRSVHGAMPRSQGCSSLEVTQ